MKQKDILLILIPLFVVVVAWIGSTIYRSVVSSTISEATNVDISPITPTFNTKIIDKLKQRQTIDPSFELESITATPSPILPTETQIVSPQDTPVEEKITL